MRKFFLTSLFLLVPFATFAEQGKTTTTTQQAADAAKRQGEQGQSNPNNAKQLDAVMNEIDGQGGSDTPPPNPASLPSEQNGEGEAGGGPKCTAGEKCPPGLFDQG